MSAIPRAETLTSPPQAFMLDPSSDYFSETPFDSYPDADIILRSSDSHEYQVPKLYIINSSPILAKLVRTAPITSDAASSAPGEPGASLARVQLPDNHTILSCLLTFIFPVSPILPPTTEQIMELLSVAQKYEMKSALIHIRDRIARQDLSFIRPENALYVFSLAQRYKLRDEVLKAARITLGTSMTFDDLDGQLGIMPGAFLYELWKYHQRVRGNLLLDLLGFRMTGARGTLKDLHCLKLSSFGIPSWLEDYIESIRNSPSCFDLTKFHMSLTRHTSPTTTLSSSCPSCASISSEMIHAFWGALTAVVHNSFRRVSVDESGLLYQGAERFPGRIRSLARCERDALPKPHHVNRRSLAYIGWPELARNGCNTTII
jgi:BTB/POZ domain